MTQYVTAAYKFQSLSTTLFNLKNIACHFPALLHHTSGEWDVNTINESTGSDNSWSLDKIFHLLSRHAN